MHSPELRLHSASRIHAAEKYAEWAEHYVNSGASSRPNSDESYGIFPRYLMLEAIQTAVERLDADSLPEVEATRALLIEAVDRARSAMTDNVASNAIAKHAMDDERAKMITFLRNVDEQALARIEPLPYRHVLPENECDGRWGILAARWNIDTTHAYWYPLSGDARSDLVAFDAGYFGRDVHLKVLRTLVQRLTGGRVWEFREAGLCAEVSVALLEPVYTGEEGYWSDSHAEWILYASHESSLAVGGSLLVALKGEWPEWQQFVWQAQY